MKNIRVLLAAILVTTVLFSLPVAHSRTLAPRSGARPVQRPIEHVFIYVMENTSYNDIVGSEEAPFLNSLIDHHALATNYTATGHASLDNYIAMTSGQPPNPATSADCFFYGTPFCIQDVDNIADQLEAAGFTWKGYMDSMKDPCQHTDENTVEQSQTYYSPRHNPFVYYRSIVDDQMRCETHVVGLKNLKRDMAQRKVPNYSFITPDTCHDGHDTGDHCEKGGGVPEADWFASKMVPRILRDRSWKRNGLLVLTFDEGGVVDDDNPASLESGNVDFGGHVFTLLVSPAVTPGTTLDEPLDHYSLLKTVEDIFCLDHLGGAAAAGTRSMIGVLHQPRCALEE